MKKTNRVLAGIVLVILLVVILLGFAIRFVQKRGNFEDRGELLGGLFCFSVLEIEIIVLLLLMIAAAAGAYLVYLQLNRKARLVENALTVLEDAYLRIARINYVSGKCIFIKDDDKMTDKLFRECDWLTFRDGIMDEIHPEDVEMYKNFVSLGNMRRVCQNVPGSEVCTYRRLRDGEYKWIRVVLIPMREKKYANYVLMCARDVEEAVKAEEYRKAQMMESLQKAKESEAEKADFLKFMAYDLHTPMNAVAKMSQLAQEALKGGDVEAARYYMERVKSMGDYSSAMLNDIMRRGILMEEHINVSKAPFSVEKLLASCTEYAAALKRENVAFELVADETLQKNYMGDSLRLTQVLYCLLSNAYKFNREGGSVKLEVLVEEHGKDADRVTFHVEDTGCGIGDDFLPDLFEPFARERQLTESGSMGVGYGLALAKSVSDALGADISVDSEPGQGSKFTLSLWLNRG